jgi:O-antigen/teichoic acid export membrane protein
VPVRVAETGSAFLNRILQVFFPGFAAMDREREFDRIRRIYTQANALQLLAITPFFLAMAVEGETLLRLWINPEFARDAAPIVLLVCLNFWISSLTNLPTLAALAFGFPQLMSKYSLIRMAVTVVAGYPLVQQWGLMGAAVALLLSELPGLALIAEGSYRVLGVQVMRRILRLLLQHFGLALLLWLAYEWWWKHSAHYSPWGVGALLALHLLLCWASGLFGPEERQRVRSLLLKWR